MKLTIGSMGFGSDGVHCESHEVELTSEEFDEYLSALGSMVRETGRPMYLTIPEDIVNIIRGE